ncbi:MAG: hypothetical protein II916_03985 [Oscillospiraceae bacterium]|nr:hypothetical protein [Oscillospiraceae bacterium]
MATEETSASCPAKQKQKTAAEGRKFICCGFFGDNASGLPAGIIHSRIHLFSLKNQPILIPRDLTVILPRVKHNS